MCLLRSINVRRIRYVFQKSKISCRGHVEKRCRRLRLSSAAGCGRLYVRRRCGRRREKHHARTGDPRSESRAAGRIDRGDRRLRHFGFKSGHSHRSRDPRGVPQKGQKDYRGIGTRLHVSARGAGRGHGHERQDDHGHDDRRGFACGGGKELRLRQYRGAVVGQNGRTRLR